MTIRHRHVALAIVTTVGIGLVNAQDVRGVHFKGVINDYSPSTVSGGPYEIRGAWTLDVRRTGTADFTADVTMQTSDYGITDATAVDPANPATRSPHTHHISLTDAAISYDTSVCPANTPATGATGVVISGTAPTTGNGGPAAFEAKGPSNIQVCITGGSLVAFSNMTLVYTGPATGHFGSQPIHGGVTTVSTK